VTTGRIYVTVAEAAQSLDRTDRTIRRWMSARLVAVYRRGDGRIVLDLAELKRLEQRQRRRTGARVRRRDRMLAELHLVSYPRD